MNDGDESDMYLRSSCPLQSLITMSLLTKVAYPFAMTYYIVPFLYATDVHHVSLVA
jgi:hypothetical protein